MVLFAAMRWSVLCQRTYSDPGSIDITTSGRKVRMISVTVESIVEVLAKFDTIAPVTMVDVAPVDLAGFDRLCTQMGMRQ
jgi:hypothetical protein